jgi:hypothetical protein
MGIQLNRRSGIQRSRGIKGNNSTPVFGTTKNTAAEGQGTLILGSVKVTMTFLQTLEFWSSQLCVCVCVDKSPSLHSLPVYQLLAMNHELSSTTYVYSTMQLNASFTQ